MALSQRFDSTIETKEAQWKTPSNLGIEHNNVEILLKGDGGPLNPFQTGSGTDDPMRANSGSRIGDQITIRGLKIMGFFEGALNRLTKSDQVCDMYTANNQDS
jgi:hypothetical protein